ncbi:hypothetical protein C7271_20855 [filamentous cyanobacterium CCP5]|nr:hypothetical protein C7293_18625 [filamentous cyanobacterium CCT1]PSN15476.1 hypothetical protein C7271_20855 [filamentous cyanobacterium CCP5]PSN79109.1 hypothetical protein C8B47_13460 [filamentous cyanobacterium CCP4]
MSDALDRLKQRQRPKVAPRDASLTSRPQDIEPSSYTDIQASRHINTQMSRYPELIKMDEKASMAGISEMPESRHIDVQMSSASGLSQEMEVSRHIDTQTSKRLDDEPMTKRSTFRLEVNLIDRLHTFCRQQGLSREVLIEAMYEYMEANPEALAQVVENASQKHDHRQQLANRKRAEAMMSKFGRDV